MLTRFSVVEGEVSGQVSYYSLRFGYKMGDQLYMRLIVGMTNRTGVPSYEQIRNLPQYEECLFLEVKSFKDRLSSRFAYPTRHKPFRKTGKTACNDEIVRRVGLGSIRTLFLRNKKTKGRFLKPPRTNIIS